MKTLNKIHKNYPIQLAVFLLGLLFSIPAVSQNFLIERIYEAETATDAVYSVCITNTSRDSIMVLHTQEASLPPFINRYKFENIKKGGREHMTVFLGKSNNPFLPEQYRAAKMLEPKEKLSLYFVVPKTYMNDAKMLQVWFSMLENKYVTDFRKLESYGGNSMVKRCRKIKEKHGVVFNRTLQF